jgi:Rps23 Pro-64 3,4-dihydroxylase Tpa1-like proline 4-hydroxylase
VTWIDFSRWDLPALTAAWRAARPFPHVVVDDVLPEDKLQQLRVAVSREPHTPNVDHFYEMMGSGLPVLHPVLFDFATALGAPDALGAIEAISGKRLGSVEMRSYVYLAGSFLLPHSDCRSDLDRRVAYAYYLLPRETSVGGELELYECDLEGDEVVATRSSTVIEPRGNRLVIFDVSPTTLHQVREVTHGGRVSLSGWYIGPEQAP